MAAHTRSIRPICRSTPLSSSGPKSDDKPPPAKSARIVQPGIEANRSCSGVESMVAKTCWCWRMCFLITHIVPITYGVLCPFYAKFRLGSFCVLIPHRPTKLLIEPAACKSLKILEVGSRALASLLITERGICGNLGGNCAAAEATLATSLQFSMGERAKKSQPIRVGTLSSGGSLKYETTSASTQKSSTTF